MNRLDAMLHAVAAGVLGLDGDPPPAVSLVTQDATPGATMSWWVLPLMCGGVGVVIGGFWWWRRADALRRDPAAWATRKLLSRAPRDIRNGLREASKAHCVPLLALLMSPSAAGRCEHHAPDCVG